MLVKIQNKIQQDLDKILPSKQRQKNSRATIPCLRCEISKRSDEYTDEFLGECGADFVGGVHRQTGLDVGQTLFDRVVDDRSVLLQHE